MKAVVLVGPWTLINVPLSCVEGEGHNFEEEEVVGSHNRSDEPISVQSGVGTRLQGGDDQGGERYEYVGEPLKHFFVSGGGRC